MTKNRRAILKLASIAGAGAVTATDKWTRPVVKSVLLPAHATVSTCCFTMCCFSTGEVNVTVTSAILCDGTITINGNGAGPGNWGGSGPVAPDGSFSFNVVPEIPGNQVVTVSGTADCCGFQGTFGTVVISGINPACN